jgi:hypothetical protein
LAPGGYIQARGSVFFLTKVPRVVPGQSVEKFDHIEDQPWQAADQEGADNDEQHPVKKCPKSTSNYCRWSHFLTLNGNDQK